MSLNIKAILFDVDKTLVDRECLMSDELKDALFNLKNKGYLLGINSGRPVFSSLRVLEKNGVTDLFDIFYGCNGLEFYDTKSKLSTYLDEIGVDTIHELDKLFHEDYLELSFYKDNKILCLNHKISDENKIKEWASVRFVEPKYVDFSKIDYSIPKLVILFKKEYHNQIVAKVNNIKNDKVDIFFSGDECMEIVPRGINKGTAVLDLSKKLAINPKNILTCGDAENDLPALLLGEGVFVGDKREDIKYSCEFKELAQFLNNTLL